MSRQYGFHLSFLSLTKKQLEVISLYETREIIVSDRFLKIKSPVLYALQGMG